MLTEQEIFNTVVNHLRKQNCKSEIGYFCQYKMEDPSKSGTYLKCAIGCLIPDERYDPILEKIGSLHSFWNCKKWEHISNFYISNFKEKFEHAKNLLFSLQALHDVTPVNKWESQFKNIAQIYQLQVPEKEEIKEELNKET